MCRNKSIIIGFFKFPFCGDFSLHLHKMVRMARNFTRAVSFQRLISKLANSEINYNISCFSGEHTELRRSITNDNNIMYKFNDKSLAKYRCKQKQNLWATLKATVSPTLSPNLVSNSYIFLVGLCQATRCPGEALNLCAKFSKFLIPLFLSASSLSLSEI